MIKHSMGTKGTFDKMYSLVRGMEFVNLEEADKRVEWEKAQVAEL